MALSFSSHRRPLPSAAAATSWPACPAGARILLYGGSFDPPHAGHLAVSARAQRALKADYVWWLVSPQNPLKPKPAHGLKARVARARAMLRHPRQQALALEQQLGTNYAIDTVRALQRHYPQARFVWLMGADAMADLHRWKNWAALMRRVPLAVYPRGTATLRAGLSPAAQRFRQARRKPGLAAQLALLPPPAWLILDAPLTPWASRALRAQQSSRALRAQITDKADNKHDKHAQQARAA